MSLNKLEKLETYSVQNKAWTLIKTLSKKSKQSIVNKVFKNYYKELNLRLQREAQPDAQDEYLDILADRRRTDVEIELNKDNVVIRVNGQTINVTIGDHTLEEFDEIHKKHNIVLVPNSGTNAIQQQIEIIKSKESKKRQRGLLGSLYKHQCDVHNVECDLLYPDGTIEEFTKRLIERF